jgi:hypothetical protein
MCLTISKNNPEPMTAEQDIVCYKVLRKEFHNGALRAPLYKFDYCFGYVYTIPEEYFDQVYVFDDGYRLAEYGFHSFVALSDAVRFKECLSEALRQIYDFVIVRCVIPNGARYYAGKQKFNRHEDNSPDGYCSEAIRIDEMVNENVE